MPPWALLTPSPDPARFVRPRASRSSSALPYSSPCLAISSKSLGKKTKIAQVASSPPRLQPLVFTKIDLRLSPPTSPMSASGRDETATTRDRSASSSADTRRERRVLAEVSSSQPPLPLPTAASPRIVVSEMLFKRSASPVRLPTIIRKLTPKRAPPPVAHDEHPCAPAEPPARSLGDSTRLGPGPATAAYMHTDVIPPSSRLSPTLSPSIPITTVLSAPSPSSTQSTIRKMQPPPPPSSWVGVAPHVYAASDDGHASTPANVRRNGSFTAIARRLRRWSGSDRQSEETDHQPFSGGDSIGSDGDMPRAPPKASSKLTKVHHRTRLPHVDSTNGEPIARAISTEGHGHTDTDTDGFASPLRPRSKLTKPRPTPYLAASTPSPLTTMTPAHVPKITPDASSRPKFVLGDPASDVDLPSAVIPPPPAPARPPLRRGTARTDVRWTLARAIADEAVSDAALVREIQRLRITDLDAALDIRLDRAQLVPRAGDEAVVPSTTNTTTEDTRSTSGLAPANERPVAAAQRTLLVCREILLTETRYLALICTLLAGHTATPAPPLMLHYMADVVDASAGVCADMTHEPGAAGIARAFLDHEVVIEEAYVRWCGVVGGWFVNGEERSVRKRRSRQAVAASGGGEEEGASAGPLSGGLNTPKRSTWRKSTTSVPALAVQPLQAHVHLPARTEGAVDEEHEGAEAQKRHAHTVRELAILPTQRVTRYVLLFRDLLKHIPPHTPARSLVERACAAAARIAARCDRAQGHAAFIAGAPQPSNSTATMQHIVKPPATATRAGSGASTSSRATRESVLSRSDTGASASASGSGSSEGWGADSGVTTPEPGSPALGTAPFALSPSASVEGTAVLGKSVGLANGRRPPRRAATGGDEHDLYGYHGAPHLQDEGTLAPGHTRRTSMSAVSLSLMSSMARAARAAGGGGRGATPPPSAGPYSAHGLE